LTKDNVDGDKTTPSSEEGDDDDGPVIPKGDTWPPAQHQGLLDVLCMNKWTYKRRNRKGIEQDGDIEEDNPNFVNVRRPKFIVYRLAIGLEEDLFVLSSSQYLSPNGFGS
jgi:hypothetical protein